MENPKLTHRASLSPLRSLLNRPGVSAAADVPVPDETHVVPVAADVPAADETHVGDEEEGRENIRDDEGEAEMAEVADPVTTAGTFSCSCRTGCSTRRCSCRKNGAICLNCPCKSCLNKNPLD